MHQCGNLQACRIVQNAYSTLIIDFILYQVYIIEVCIYGYSLTSDFFPPTTGNTVSNLAMIIPALIGMWSCFKSGLEPRYMLGYFGLLGDRTR